MRIVTVRCEGVIAASLSGDGVNMRINSEGASGVAEGRRGGTWDDEE